MDETMKKARERFYSEFTQMFSKAASKEDWSKDCVEIMKDLLKSIYYIDVLDAMHNPEEYDENYSRNGYDRGYNSYDQGRSNARGRDSMGRFTSRDGGYGMSGRHFYGSYNDDRMATMERLQGLMNNEPNNEVRMALQNAMNELNMR